MNFGLNSESKAAAGTNELNRMHWAIKKINAVEVLRKLDTSLFIYKYANHSSGIEHGGII